MAQFKDAVEAVCGRRKAETVSVCIILDAMIVYNRFLTIKILL